MKNNLLEKIKVIEQQARRMPRVEKLLAGVARASQYTNHGNELKRAYKWLREEGEQVSKVAQSSAILNRPIRTQQATRQMAQALTQIREVSQTIEQSHMQGDQINMVVHRKLPLNYKPILMSGDELRILQQAIDECCKQSMRLSYTALHKQIFQKYQQLGGYTLTTIQQLSEKICYDVLYLVNLQRKKHGNLVSIDVFDKQS